MGIHGVEYIIVIIVIIHCQHYIVIFRLGKIFFKNVFVIPQLRLVLLLDLVTNIP